MALLLTTGRNTQVGIASPNPSYKEDVQVVTGEQEVVVRGKNLLPILREAGDYSESGVTIKINTDKTISLNGTATADISIPLISTTGASNVFTLPAGTYTRNATTDGNAISGIQIQLRENNGSGSHIFSAGVGLETKTITETKTVYCRLRILNGTAITNLTLYPMLVSGEYTISTFPTYEPYITPITKTLSLGDIELAKIPNTSYRDCFITDRSTGKWYVHKAVGKRIFDGTESWQIGQSGTDNWYYSISENIGGMTGSAVAQLKCNYYQYASITSTTTGEGIWYSTSSVRIRYGTQDTPANFKTWLSTHNVLLYYILIEATDTEITDTTLINQLEDIYNMQSVNGTTIVEINGNLPMIMKVRALKNG